MKKITTVFLLMVCVLSTGLGQNSDFRTQINSIFENVDLSQVPSGVLSDYGLSLVDGSRCNGQIVSNNVLLSQIRKSF
jgi:hypothetical protein